MSLEVSNLDHLGLVAGLVDEIGMVALINEQLDQLGRSNPPAYTTSG